MNNGVDIPMIGFGTWDVRGEEGVSAMACAIRTGYRMFEPPGCIATKGRSARPYAEAASPAAKSS